MNDHTDPPRSPPTPISAAAISDARLRRYAWIALAIAIVVAVWGIVSRVSARNTLSRQTSIAAATTVVTVRPTIAPGSEVLVLPGSVQAYYEAPIYARTNGYLKTWTTDIGMPVKKGQVLAEIESPEVDQQLSQAQADLASAEANYELARTTDVRWRGLLQTQSVSKQDADQRAGDAAAKKAAVESADANVARLRDMESFKRVLAPFDGVVTQRNTDIGALINAGQSPGQALFRVADTHRLRIYVSVPQAYASAIEPGMKADLVFAEHPGETYPATVAFTAQALDPASRTLQVELQAENAQHKLFPGSYAEVHFNMAAAGPTLRLPANAVLFRAEGLLVAVVGSDNHVRLKRVTEGRDFGSSIEILGGINAGDDIVINPPDSITDGALVRIVQPASPAKGQAPS
jgi:RND family efflux transporter MFP subunit